MPRKAKELTREEKIEKYKIDTFRSESEYIDAYEIQNCDTVKKLINLISDKLNKYNIDNATILWNTEDGNISSLYLNIPSYKIPDSEIDNQIKWREESERRYKEDSKKRKLQREQEELKEYQRLKKKFEAKS